MQRIPMVQVVRVRTAEQFLVPSLLTGLCVPVVLSPSTIPPPFPTRRSSDLLQPSPLLQHRRQPSRCPLYQQRWIALPPKHSLLFRMQRIPMVQVVRVRTAEQLLVPTLLTRLCVPVVLSPSTIAAPMIAVIH